MCGKLSSSRRPTAIWNVRHAGGLGQVAQCRMVRMEAERDKGLESAGLILQLAQLEKVIDAVFVVLNVAIQHRGIGAQTGLVCQSRGVEPL